MKSWQILLVIMLFVAVGGQAQSPDRLGEIVELQSGRLRGIARDSEGVLSFKGIPYALPPVGARRWRAPEPVQPWTDTREATSVGNRCWSNTQDSGLGGRGGTVPQSEDCLYLNVWTSARSAQERRPVMVWIHGGGFQFGTAVDARTDGAPLARRGVVVVSLNYRLGVFGFFADPQLRDQGRLASNFGIQDQIAALRWVKINIAKFGGDPANITIFGESSGSQAVSILMGSPLAQGLFQKAIGESGSSLQQLPSVLEMAMRGAAFAGALGVKSIEDLRAMPADRINLAAAWDFQHGAPPVFAPAVDDYLLPAQLTDIFREGRQNDVPLLAGYNKREDFPFLAAGLPHNTPEEFRAAAQRVFGAAKMQQFLSLYPSNTASEAKLSSEQLLGDIRQAAETWSWLTLESKTGNSAVYGYRFSYESPYSPVASHAADVSFVFGNLVPQVFAPKAPPASPMDITVSHQLMSYWVNFAKNGNPNGPGLPYWPNFRERNAMLQIEEDGRILASSLSPVQIARFRFLDNYLIAASFGEK